MLVNPIGKKEKDIIVALTNVVKPDVLSSSIYLLTGTRARKEDLKIQRLNNEAILKRVCSLFSFSLSFFSGCKKAIMLCRSFGPRCKRI